jgi:hypothetical protein
VGTETHCAQWLLLLASVTAVGLLALVLTGAAATGDTPDAHESYDAYRILVDRNIFLRYRRPPRPDRPFESRGNDEPEPEPRPRLVLTGTARSGDGYIAFFEDERTGETRRAAAGKTLAGVRLKAITLDGVEIEDEGTTRTIQIGSDLSGRATTLPTRSTAAAAPPAPPPPGDEGAATEGAEDTPEEPEPDGEADGEEAEPATPGTSAEDDDEDAGEGDIAEILERMRRRREEELRR